MWVVDASMALSWCFEDETTDATEAVLERLLREGGIVPAHWPLEVANGLRSAERRGRLDERKLAAARDVFEHLPIDVIPMDLDSALDVIDFARRTGLTVYDAAYVDLALSRGIGLATADRRLADACVAVGVELVA